MTQEETEHPLVSLASLTIEPFSFVTCLLTSSCVMCLPWMSELFGRAHVADDANVS